MGCKKENYGTGGYLPSGFREEAHGGVYRLRWGLGRLTRIVSSLSVTAVCYLCRAGRLAMNFGYIKTKNKKSNSSRV